MAKGLEYAAIPETVIPQTALPLSPAARVCSVVILTIRAFEAQLGSGDEVAMGFAGSEAGVLRIDGLGYHAPDLVTFHGRDDDGRQMQLIQHVSQVSVVLRAVPKAEPEAPARRIGFLLTAEHEWPGGEAGDASAQVTTV